MDKVCEDKFSEWYYDRENDQFIRKYDFGGKMRIKGSSIPDPERIKEIKYQQKMFKPEILEQLWEFRESFTKRTGSGHSQESAFA